MKNPTIERDRLQKFAAVLLTRSLLLNEQLHLEEVRRNCWGTQHRTRLEGRVKSALDRVWHAQMRLIEFDREYPLER